MSYLLLREEGFHRFFLSDFVFVSVSLSVWDTGDGGIIPPSKPDHGFLLVVELNTFNPP